jgi:hypothetical protein
MPLHCVGSSLHVITGQSHLEVVLKGKEAIFIFIEKFNGIHAFNLVRVVYHVFSEKLTDIIGINFGVNTSVGRSVQLSLKSFEGGIGFIVWLCREPLALFFNNAFVLRDGFEKQV